MKRNHRFIVLALFFWVLCVSQVSAQRIDALAPSGSFSEVVFLAYSFYYDDAFEVYLDNQGAVAVRSICDNMEEILVFIDEKSDVFKHYAMQSKEEFGVQNKVWREGLPAELYAALVKQENLRADRQNNLCSNAYPFCTDNGLYEFPAGVNAGTGEPGPYYSCLGTQPNPAWYYMRILDPGDMDIYMYSTPQVDIDFCCWGPFDDPFSPCPDGLTRNKVVSCSYSTDWEETCKIRNAQAGDFFILLITNYSNRHCNIHFSKVSGDATTDCGILPPLVSYDSPACEGKDLQFLADGSLGDSFHWFFMNGEWTSDMQNPVRPNATRDMSGTYGCVITRNGQQSDTTYLEVVVGENTHYYVEDEACDSIVWDGVVYTESGLFTQSWPTLSGCDSVVDLNITINYTADFEIEGNHWPIGGSETYISVNEYAIALVNTQSHVDTVLWQVDCENWRIEPHGHGETCTLYIYSFLEEPVMLHVATCNICDTITQDYFIQTSYFGIDETDGSQNFVVSPNPTNGNLVLHFVDLEGMVEIGVFNAQGQKVDAFSVDVNSCQEMTYKIPAIVNGVCYLMLQHQGKTLIRKVAVIR